MQLQQTMSCSQIEATVLNSQHQQLVLQTSCEELVHSKDLFQDTAADRADLCSNRLIRKNV